MWRPFVRALASVAAVVAVALIVVTAPASSPATPPATTSEPAGLPVWVLEEDGTWTCTPALSPACNCALPPPGLGPQPAVVNEPWECDQLDATDPWAPALLEDNDE